MLIRFYLMTTSRFIPFYTTYLTLIKYLYWILKSCNVEFALPFRMMFKIFWIIRYDNLKQVTFLNSFTHKLRSDFLLYRKTWYFNHYIFPNIRISKNFVINSLVLPSIWIVVQYIHTYCSALFLLLFPTTTSNEEACCKKNGYFSFSKRPLSNILSLSLLSCV